MINFVLREKKMRVTIFMIDLTIAGNMIGKTFGFAKLLIIVHMVTFKTWFKNAIKEEEHLKRVLQDIMPEKFCIS
jgi:hypothetical protein